MKERLEKVIEYENRKSITNDFYSSRFLNTVSDPQKNIPAVNFS